MATVVTVVEVGDGEFEVTINETAADSAQVVQIDGLPMNGTVRRVQAQLVSGAGATIQPLVGRTNAPATAEEPDIVVDVLTTPAAAADRCGSATYRVSTVTAGLGTLWLASRVDAGVDNVINTTIHVTSGW